MDRRKFLGATPLALGAAMALAPKASLAQTQSSAVTSVKSFGAIGDGVTDDTSAIANALNYAGGLSSPGSVFFPDGTYLIKSGLVVPTGVSVFGTGRGTSIIIVGAANVVALSHTNATYSYANIGISDLCIRTSQAGVTGIQFTLCEITCIDKIVFEGCTQNMIIDRGQNHRVTSVVGRGYGSNPSGTFRFWSSTDSDYIYNVHVDSLLIENIGTGVNTSVDPAAIYLRRGILCFFSKMTAGDLTDGGTSAANFIIVENDCQGCKFSQCMGVYSALGVVVRQGTGAVAMPTFTEFSGIDIDQATLVAVQINEAKWLTFTGGNITPRGGYTNVNPVVFNAGASEVAFSGTTVYGFTGGAGFYFNGATYVSLNNCFVDGCYYAYVFAAGNNIRISGGSALNCSNKYNGSYGAVGNYYSGINGFNPFAVGTPAMPASGAVTTNSEGVRCTVYLGGGSVNAIAINGQVLPAGIVAGSFDLEPGESISINYSSPPQWSWLGH